MPDALLSIVPNWRLQVHLFERLRYIYDASTSDAHWGPVLDQFSDTFGSGGVAVYSANRIGFEFSVNETNSLFLNREEDMAAYFSRFGHYDRFSVPYVARSEAFRFVSDAEIWPDVDLRNGRDDMNFLREKFGVWRRGAVNLSRFTGWDAVLTFQFPFPDQVPVIGHDDDRLVLCQHLGKVLEINRFYSQLRKQYQAVLTVLDHVDVALCIVLQTGEVLFSNQRAQQVFDSANGITLSSTMHLRLKDEEQTAAIKSFVADCSATAMGATGQKEHIVQVRKCTFEEPYLVEISPLRDGDDELNDSFAGALMMIIDPRNPPSLSTGSLAILHALTPAEIDVTEYLLEGHTLPEIADIRNVSANTIRNQLKAIYDKTNVSSRTQLIRKISNLSPPIRTPSEHLLNELRD